MCGHDPLMDMSNRARYLEIRRITPELELELAEFFEVLANVSEDEFFAPHPFTMKQAARLANYSGNDFYCLVLYKARPIAYGLLRGWDEGYAIPSLGIVVHHEYRSCGVGLALTYYLHAVAVLKGAKSIRLRVNKNNHRAKSFYEKLGYQLNRDKDDDRFLIGLIELTRAMDNLKY